MAFSLNPSLKNQLKRCNTHLKIEIDNKSIFSDGWLNGKLCIDCEVTDAGRSTAIL